jgi:hypothetical protein
VYVFGHEHPGEDAEIVFGACRENGIDQPMSGAVAGEKWLPVEAGKREIMGVARHVEALAALAEDVPLQLHGGMISVQAENEKRAGRGGMLLALMCKREHALDIRVLLTSLWAQSMLARMANGCPAFACRASMLLARV